MKREVIYKIKGEKCHWYCFPGGIERYSVGSGRFNPEEAFPILEKAVNLMKRGYQRVTLLENSNLAISLLEGVTR